MKKCLVDSELKEMERTLAIVNSPLQAMFAMSYIKEYGISEVDFVVPVYSVKFLKYNRGVLRYLNDEGQKYKIFVTKNIFAIFRYYNSLGKYSRFIIGDYRSIDKRLLTLFFSKKTIDVIYVDDGNASLVIGSKKRSSLSLRSIVPRIVNSLLDKRIRSQVFYSAFITDEKVLGIPVVRNNLLLFHNNKKPKGNNVVIVGCYFSAFREFGEDYHIYLHKLNEYIIKKWPQSKVLYYPHRRENDVEAINEECKELGWLLCQSRINIETDIVKSKEQPCEIIGFGSSALYLLKILCKDVPVTTVHFNETRDYLEIEKKYSESGINVIDFK